MHGRGVTVVAIVRLCRVCSDHVPGTLERRGRWQYTPVAFQTSDLCMYSALPATPADRRVAIWLFACCAMILFMVVLGGLTRLTDSGLSMVDWRPITGWLPPLSEAAWEETFAAYREYPEFIKQNSHMGVDEFKSIFWLEYLHRVWGRLIGLAFAIPLLVFAFTGQIRRSLLPRFAAMFVLGAMQGLMGWVMVMSGLVERPDVSQYRLSAHLGLAFALYGWIFWVALGLVHQPTRSLAPPRPALAGGLLAMIGVTVLSGGFVAGLDAGLAYNSFPRMGAHWFPPEALMLEPWWRNFLENMAAVQFGHRVLALLTAALVLAWWWWQRRGRALAAHLLLAVVLLQVSLGIATLLLYVPLPLAAAHQLNGLLLFTAAIYNLHVHARGRSAAP